MRYHNKRGRNSGAFPRTSGNRGGGTDQELQSLLNRIDGRPYPCYKDLSGTWDFEEFRVTIDRVQGDAYAPPTRVLVHVPGKVARFPENLYSRSKVRRLALCDYLTRVLGTIVRNPGRNSRDRGWSGEKGGDVNVAQCGQYVLERSAVTVDPMLGNVEVRLTMALPAKGRNILGRLAANMLLERLPEYVSKGLKFSSLDSKKLYRHVEVVEDAEALRNSLKQHNLVAFIADGSILPRQSGSSEKPLNGNAAVPFASPDKYRVSLKTPNRGDIIGMGIPTGITLIVGGGFHGKSTLLEAIQTGIYNKVPGDGREFVVTDPSSVKIRAEDGRRVASVDISPFIGQLPGGKQTQCFSTEDASGSTSQAANIQEAIEQQCSLLLLDEDSTASNLMMRDSRMQELIHRDLEPITPFSHQITAMKMSGVSTIFVVGGSGEYFSLADHIIAMKNYHASDVTDAAKEIASRYEGSVSGMETTQSTYPSVALRTLLKNEFSTRRPKIKVRSLHLVDIDSELLDLNGLEQIVEEGQTKSLACAIAVLAKRAGGQWAGKSFREVLELLDNEIEKHGLSIISEDPMAGDLTRPRMFEIAASINRLRNAMFAQCNTPID